MTHHTGSDEGRACGSQYGRNPDLCHRPTGHAGAHWNQWGTTWANTPRAMLAVPHPAADPSEGDDRG